MDQPNLPMPVKSILNRKVFAFALLGWVGWPTFLAIFFIAYRITSEMSMETWARYAGKLQATVWFQENRYRLLELSPDGPSKFTGRKDGEFEIWTSTHYANPSWFTADNQDREYVDAFNRRMRHLWAEKQNEKK